MFERARQRTQSGGGAGHRRMRLVFLLLGSIVADGLRVWLRTGRPGGWVVVRCRDGHLFTTLWIPAVSVKALRFGPWRFQRCPVGRHWSLVTPVNAAELSPAQRDFATATRDLPIP